MWRIFSVVRPGCDQMSHSTARETSQRTHVHRLSNAFQKIPPTNLQSFILSRAAYTPIPVSQLDLSKPVWQS